MLQVFEPETCSEGMPARPPDQVIRAGSHSPARKNEFFHSGGGRSMAQLVNLNLLYFRLNF